MKRYEHTQVGYLTITVIGAVIILLIVLLTREFSWIAIGALIVIVAMLVLFASLTVVISKDELEVRFGPGLIRKRFSLNEIESCSTVRNPWYYGWGIRSTPHGLMYNVSGFQAVEILLRSGYKFRIGTDVPQELCKAIMKAIS